ncbi:nucleotidyltransferase domain-containing protein [Candidatus Poribacteria bacterium]
MDELIEHKIIEEMKEYFGSELVSVVLFGSQARGTADEHSDIDLVVIAEGVPSDWHEQGEIINELRTSPALIRLPVSIILKSPDVVIGSLESVQPLLFGILKSYKALYDPDNFFEIQAEVYRKHMQEWDVQEIGDHVWEVGVIARNAKRRANSKSLPSGGKS